MVYAWIAQGETTASLGWVWFLVGILIGGPLGALGLRFMVGMSISKAKAEAASIVETAEIKAKAEKQERELELEKELRARRDELEKEIDESRFSSRLERLSMWSRVRVGGPDRDA